MPEKRSRFSGLIATVILFIIWSRTNLVLAKDTCSHFYYHEVVQPDIYNGAMEKRDITSIKVQNEERLTITFSAFNKDFILDLWKNSLLLPPHYFEKHYENGTHVINSPMKDNPIHCYYQGQLRNINSSSAAISTCRGLRGVIDSGNEIYYIQPDTLSSNDSHFLFQAKDLKPQNLTCGVSDSSNFWPKSHILKLFKRDIHSTKLRNPYQSNEMSRYVELVIVNDNREFKKLKEDRVAVFEQSKEVANIINGLYAPLNIFITLVGVVIWSDKDEIEVSSNGELTLMNFLRYRREKLSQEHPNDHAHLITGMPLDGAAVGKALKGVICTHEYSGGVTFDHSAVAGVLAANVAHSLGHNFGMEHDTPECRCPDNKCIMAPTFGPTIPRHWSSCSLEFLELAFSHGMDYCLKNLPVKVIGPVCGNGFLEEGEECDCGETEFCDSLCCNASSCQLFSNATCGTGACCDLETCQPMEAATLCRNITSECDLPEYCDGVSEFCPADTFYQNGEECGKGKAYCYDGQCKSHTDQCKLLWGDTGRVSDLRCFDQNIKENRNGNCGYDRFNQTYTACRKEDILCGLLHCTHFNERLEFGMESAAILGRSFIRVEGKILTCRTANVDLGLLNTDPGLVPNGAKCGEGKACVNQKCTPISSIKSKECLHNCSGNGVCNNKGNCHCNVGYDPPYCTGQGAGGSIDSGPASDTMRFEEHFGSLLQFIAKMAVPHF